MVNSFANYYKNRLWRNEVAVKKDMRRKELKVKPRPGRPHLLTFFLSSGADEAGGG